MFRAVNYRTDKRFTLCLDEFPYLVEQSSELPSVLQKLVDEKQLKYNLVLCGSSQNMMYGLLSDENNSLWSSVLYGTSGEDNQIVAVALSQVGNVGGRPYWSWYGFNSRVEWCACFVSWCANECGYIETGIIPKYASCVNGVQWFKDRGQWLDGSAKPLSGMIIFYDWDKQGQSGQQDGRADHTGIVWKVENGYVYTIEGNLSDKCTTSRRQIGEYQILGYGVPLY